MALATTVNLTPTAAAPTATPSPPSGQQAIVFANDGGAPTVNFSATDPVMEGDSGSGGLAGNVPAPAAGTAAAGKFLKADGTWATPPAGGTFVEELITFTGTSGGFSHAPDRLYGLYRNGIRMTSLAGSPAIQTFSAIGTAITLSVASGGSDVFIAVYIY
jgi:hypothetical protein